MRIPLLFAAVLIAGAPAIAQTAPTHPAPATPAPPAHPITDAQAHQLLELSGADALEKQTMNNMMKYLHQVMPPFIPADVIDDIETRLKNADFDSQVIAIYKEHLSTRDAAAAIAFYKTPAGQDLVKQLPAITRESQEAGAKLGQQIAMEVIQAHKAEIQAAAKKYEEDHSAPAEPTAPSSTPASPQSQK
jgi:hypothetical protein